MSEAPANLTASPMEDETIGLAVIQYTRNQGAVCLPFGAGYTGFD